LKEKGTQFLWCRMW